MKESCREGPANHPDPESCVASRKAASEALTGAPAGRVFELRNICIQGADVVQQGGRQQQWARFRERSEHPAQSETPGMPGNSTRENREIPSTPVPSRAGQRRP
jgi:hypothetical protein